MISCFDTTIVRSISEDWRDSEVKWSEGYALRIINYYRRHTRYSTTDGPVKISVIDNWPTNTRPGPLCSITYVTV